MDGPCAHTHNLSQRTLLTVAREGRKRQQDYEERQQDLQRVGDGQLTEPGKLGHIVGRTIVGAVLLVRFQPDGHALVAGNPGIEKRQRCHRAERIDPVVRGRVGVLFSLFRELRVDDRLRSFALLGNVAVALRCRC